MGHEGRAGSAWPVPGHQRLLCSSSVKTTVPNSASKAMWCGPLSSPGMPPPLSAIATRASLCLGHASSTLDTSPPPVPRHLSPSPPRLSFWTELSLSSVSLGLPVDCLLSLVQLCSYSCGPFTMSVPPERDAVMDRWCLPQRRAGRSQHMLHLESS